MRSLLGNLRQIKGASEGGQVLAITCLVMVSLFVVASYALDTGIWYVHARHLQTQADAAAIAGAEAYQLPCSTGVGTAGSTENAIARAVNQYNGTGLSPSNSPTYNTQYTNKTAATPSATYNAGTHNVISELNQPNFINQNFPNDKSPATHNALSGSPCADEVVDVKMTETNVPSYIPAWLNPLSFLTAPYINKEAEVAIQQENQADSAEPFVEPLPNPSSATGQLVDESTGNPIGSPFTLSPQVISGTADPTTLTGTDAVASTVTGVPNNGNIGVEITPSGSSTPWSSGTNPPYGVTYFHVWKGQGTSYPYVDDAWLAPSGTTTCPTSPGSNSPSNFVSSSSNTAIQLCANVVVPSTVTCANLDSTFQLTMNDGANVALANSACTTTTSGGTGNPNTLTWTIPSFQVTSDSGGTVITLSWQQTKNTFNGNACANGKNNPCSGSLGTIQQIFSGAYDSQSSQNSGSGSILSASITNGGTLLSSEQSASLSGGQTLTVTVHFLSFTDSSSTTNPTPLVLSFGGNQANAALECAGSSEGSTQFQGNVANGCVSSYQTTTGSCPNTDTPPSCATENPGNGKLNKDLDPGMTARVYCGGVVANCNVTRCPTTPGTNYNYWTTGSGGSDQLATIRAENPTDPRLITLLVTDNGGLGSGSNQNGVPIRIFAKFYVTGWYGDPCNASTGGTSGGPVASGLPAAGLYYTPDPDPSTASPAECTTSPNGSGPQCSGILLGHFVGWEESLGSGSGSGTPCVTNFSSISNCIPVFVK